MNYPIHITSAAQSDIANASDYVEFILKNPKAVDDLLDHIELKINTLSDFPENSDFPEKYPLVKDTFLASHGIRFIPVKNYLVFYIISKENNQVVIVRFLYAKSNWMSILKQDFVTI